MSKSKAATISANLKKLLANKEVVVVDPYPEAEELENEVVAKQVYATLQKLGISDKQLTAALVKAGVMEEEEEPEIDAVDEKVCATLKKLGLSDAQIQAAVKAGKLKASLPDPEDPSTGDNNDPDGFSVSPEVEGNPWGENPAEGDKVVEVAANVLKLLGFNIKGEEIEIEVEDDDEIEPEDEEALDQVSDTVARLMEKGNKELTARVVARLTSSLNLSVIGLVRS